MKLRPAVVEDLTCVLSWISTAESLRLWGGPLLSFPPEVKVTWQEIGADCQNSFVLEDQRNQILGFGQTLLREAGVIHFARIILAPQVRGRGWGRELCEQLMRQSLLHHRPTKFTLNVYRDNQTALALYRRLGFRMAQHHPMQGAYAMEFICSGDT